MSGRRVSIGIGACLTGVLIGIATYHWREQAGPEEVSQMPIVREKMRPATESRPEISPPVADSEELQAKEPAPPVAETKRVYGDGSPINVTWRGSDFGGYPEPPYGPQYDDLLKRATEGDREAAFKLFHILEKCQSAFDTEEEKDEAIRIARSQWALVRPGHPPVPIANIRSSSPINIEERLEHHIAGIESFYHACYPITEEQEADRRRWLELAADGGPVEAQIYYASGLADPAEAARYYEQVWSMGSLRALDYMSHSYVQMYHSGLRPDYNVNAYAAFYAFLTIGEEAVAYFRGEDYESHPEYTRVVQERLDMLESSLTSAEIEEAKRLAMDMVRANRNCCYAY